MDNENEIKEYFEKLALLQQRTNYDSMYMWEVRERLLEMLSKYRNYSPHPDLWITKNQFLQQYEKEKLNQTLFAESSFLHSLQMYVHKETTVHKQGNYLDMPSLSDYIKEEVQIAILEKKRKSNNLKQKTPEIISSHTIKNETKVDPFFVPDNCITVIMITEESIGIETTRYIINYIRKLRINHVFLLTTGKWTSQAAKELDEQLSDIEVERFNADIIIANIMEHVLNPHSIKALSDDEVLKLRSKYYFTTLSQFPNYDLSDPIVRFFNFKKGQLIEIRHRDNPNRRYFRMVDNNK